MLRNKLLFSLITIVILIGGVNIIPADGDRFETLKLRHSEAPEVCMFEPNPELEADRKYNFQVITRVSVDMWVDALSYKYPQGNWEIKIHPTVPWEEHVNADRSDYPHCNIMVLFEPISDGNRLGYAVPDFSKSSHKHMVVVVHTYETVPNSITFNQDGTTTRDLKPMSLTVIQAILQHELGHAFGLLHYNISNPLYAGEVGTDRSTMYPALDSETGLIHIQEPELIMIGKIYGEDGWGGKTPVLIVKECDFINNILTSCKW